MHEHYTAFRNSNTINKLVHLLRKRHNMQILACLFNINRRKFSVITATIRYPNLSFMQNVWGIISSKICDKNKQLLSAKELEVTIVNPLYNIAESAFKSLNHFYEKKKSGWGYKKKWRINIALVDILNLFLNKWS